MLAFQLLSIMIVKETDTLCHDTISTCLEIIHMNFLLLMNLITERISKAHSNKNVRLLNHKFYSLDLVEIIDGIN